jgi:AcrR family transcriptional regulator
VSAHETPGSAAATRGARRREQTRTRLLGAARELFARQGIDATRIQEITEAADVGFGSFYNHFADKDAIVAAVLRDLTDRQALAVEALTADVEDPAEIVAIAHRHFVRLAEADPTWGWLIIRLDVTHGALQETLGPRALGDLRRGIESGRLLAEDLALTVNATGGALLGTTRATLEGRTQEGAPERHAELVLRMLGVPAAEAAEIANRPFPT